MSMILEPKITRFYVYMGRMIITLLKYTQLKINSQYFSWYVRFLFGIEERWSRFIKFNKAGHTIISFHVTDERFIVMRIHWEIASVFSQLLGRKFRFWSLEKDEKTALELHQQVSDWNIITLTWYVLRRMATYYGESMRVLLLSMTCQKMNILNLTWHKLGYLDQIRLCIRIIILCHSLHLILFLLWYYYM